MGSETSPAKAADKVDAEGQRLELPGAAGGPAEPELEEASLLSGRSGADRPAGPRRETGLVSKYAAEAAELSAMVRLRAQAALVGKVAGLPEEATATSPTRSPVAPDVTAAVRLLCYQSVLGGDGSDAADLSSGQCIIASATG